MSSITGWGNLYEVRVGLKVARWLCGLAEVPLPRAGWSVEIQVARVTIQLERSGTFEATSHLRLFNVGGQFALACSTEQVGEWPETFGIDLSKTTWAERVAGWRARLKDVSPDEARIS